MKIVEVQVCLQNPAFIEHYGGKKYDDIKDKFKDDFWGCLESAVGSEDVNGDYLVASDTFIAELSNVRASMLRAMEAELEYQGKVAPMPVPVGIQEEVYERMNSDGNGPLEKRMERLIARKVKEHGIPVVFKDATAYTYV